MGLRVVETAGLTDVGRQRSTNEDSFLEQAPLFAVADGMGGARAGEVASRMALEAFHEPSDGGAAPEAQLAEITRTANGRIWQMAQQDETRAGMGTTLTVAKIVGSDVAVSHVGDSRLYRLRAGELERLTRDHSLVEELVSKGRLSPEEAENHPQRSIITRALGPEPEVEPETFTCSGRDDDVYLLCSDGLTAMVSEDEIADVIRSSATLYDAAQRLVDEANERGGRDNITVVLFRLADEDGPGEEPDTLSGHETGAVEADQVREAVARSERGKLAPRPAAQDPEATAVIGASTAARMRAEHADPSDVRRIRPPSGPSGSGARRSVLQRGARRSRRPLAVLLTLLCLAALVVGLYAGSREFYFLGTDERGLVTMYRGLPYSLPLEQDLYTRETVSTVPARTLPDRQRAAVLDHKLRSRSDAFDLLRELERTRGSGL